VYELSACTNGTGHPNGASIHRSFGSDEIDDRIVVEPDDQLLYVAHGVSPVERARGGLLRVRGKIDADRRHCGAPQSRSTPLVPVRLFVEVGWIDFDFPGLLDPGGAEFVVSVELEITCPAAQVAGEEGR